MSSSILEAIEQGDSARVREILAVDRGAATARNERGLSAVMLALYHRAQEALELLLACNPPIDAFEAAALGRRELLRELLIEGGDEQLEQRTPDGFTPLHLACYFGRAEVAELLLEAGAHANAVAGNASRLQPLHSAVASRKREIVESLLRNGASVNARQAGGHTALHAAAMHGDLDTVRLLLGYGADPLQADEEGRTPLDRAVEGGHPEIVARLEGR